MASKSFDLISPLPRDECVRRLRALTGRAWIVFSGRPVIGYVGERSLRLSKRVWYHNSFQVCLFGDFLEENDQTRLRCRFGIHPLDAAFMAVWFAGVLLIGGAMSATTVASLLSGRDSIPANAWLVIVFPLLMLGLGVAMITFGKFLSRNERRFLIDFLGRTIDACEA